MANNDNSGLAFLVGGLLVAVFVVGFMVFRLPGINYASIEPSAGTPSYSSTTTRTTTTAPGERDRDDVSRTTTRSRTETTNR